MTFTKRHLGWVCVAAGALGIIGLLAYDLLRRHAIGGAVQWAAMIGCAVLAFLGATLIPLGDQPL